MAVEVGFPGLAVQYCPLLVTSLKCFSGAELFMLKKSHPLVCRKQASTCAQFAMPLDSVQHCLLLVGGLKFAIHAHPYLLLHRRTESLRFGANPDQLQIPFHIYRYRVPDQQHQSWTTLWLFAAVQQHTHGAGNFSQGDHGMPGDNRMTQAVSKLL